MSSSRTSPCGIGEARKRLRLALAYLETAELVRSETERSEFSSVSAGLAVLAGIAASDCICCVRLRCVHRGDDHRGAARLLAQATPDGKPLSARLLRLLDVKDAAHYGVDAVAPRKASDALRSARYLVERAADEVAR